jgi:hypothetical protein
MTTKISKPYTKEARHGTWNGFDELISTIIYRPNLKGIKYNRRKNWLLWLLVAIESTNFILAIFGFQFIPYSKIKVLPKFFGQDGDAEN